MQEAKKIDFSHPSQEDKDMIMSIIRQKAINFPARQELTTEPVFIEYFEQLARLENFALACGATAYEIQRDILNNILNIHDKRKYFIDLENKIIYKGESSSVTPADMLELRKIVFPEKP